MFVMRAVSACIGSMATRSSRSMTGSRASRRRGTSGSTQSTRYSTNSPTWRTDMVAMASSGAARITLPSDTEILITREFAAPKHLVYQAWTTPELVKRWWAGQRGVVTSAQIDLRVGGQWRYVMLAHGSFEVAFHGTYREIVPNERLVTTEVYETPEAPDAKGVLNIVSFREHDARTTLTVLVQCSSKDERDMIMSSGMEGGMQEGMDLLEQVVISLEK